MRRRRTDRPPEPAQLEGSGLAAWTVGTVALWFALAAPLVIR